MHIFSYAVTSWGIVLLFSFCVNMFLALFVFFNNPKNKLNYTFSLILLLVALWNLTNFFSNSTSDYNSALVWTKIALGTVLFIPALLLFFSCIFRNKFLSLKALLGIFILPAIMLPFIGTDYNVITLERQPWGSNFIPGALYSVYTVYFIIFVFSALTNFILEYRSQKSEIIKQQIRFIFFGMAFSGIAGILTNAILPLLGTANYNIYGTPASIVFGLSVTYAITRYRFMEIKVVIKKSIIYVFSLIILICLTGLGAFYMGWFLENELNIDNRISIIIVAIILILGLPYLRDGLRKLIDKLIKKDYLDLAKKIDDFEQSSLEPRYQIPRFCQELCVEIRRALCIKNVVFYSWDLGVEAFKKIYPASESASILNIEAVPDLFKKAGVEILLRQELEYFKNKSKEDAATQNYPLEIIEKTLTFMIKHKAEIIIPLLGGGELVGFILTSAKENGRSFSNEDIEYFKYLRVRTSQVLSHMLIYEQVRRNKLK